MCKRGDIILIEKYHSQGKELGKHSFVVIDDEGGSIRGMSYDIICNVLSSFKDDEQKTKKLKYPGNFPVANEDSVTSPDNGKDGYIKTDQLYLFDKKLIKFKTIGYINPDIFELILEFIEESDFNIDLIADNL